MKNKKTKITLIIVFSFVVALVLSAAIPFIILGSKTNRIKTDWHYLKNDEKYSLKVEVTGLNLVEQHISCGYAAIEMLSEFYGKKVTEDDLNQKNGGKVSTSSTNGFYNEISASIPNKTFKKSTYLNNDVLLKEIHDSLAKNNPVAIEWAARYENDWTLHFSIVSSLDIKTNDVTVYNPYGYIENISVATFLERTTFDAYQDMPLFLNFGFAFGAFDKNAIFFAE